MSSKPMSKPPFPPLSQVGRPRLVVCGGRKYEEWETFVRKMDRLVSLMKFPIVIHGDCPTGVDEMTTEWAELRRHTHRRHYALWEVHGNAAGPIRNRKMAQDAIDPIRGAAGAWCVAFHNGRSDGTADMIEQARKCGLRVRVIRVEY